MSEQAAVRSPRRGLWSIIAFVGGFVLLGCGLVLGFRDVTAYGLDCGSPFRPAYESLELTQVDPAEPLTSLQSERLTCTTELEGGATLAVFLIVAGALVAVVAALMAIRARRFLGQAD